VLERLLRKGERARLRGDAAPASLPMTSAASAREYLALRTLDEREAFHGAIALAERAGAISVVRDRHCGDGERLLRITIAGLDALAAHLDLRLLDARVADAAHVLAPWQARFPVLDAVLDAWRRDRKVRERGPEAAGALADAARAVAACLDDPGHERILRRESVRLFGDSKRLESLTRWLDLLATGRLAADGALEKTHVWAALGLRREPQPLLLAGPGVVHLDDGDVPLRRPWLGVPVESLRALETTARCVLSIENLASFHDATRRADGSTLLLYTGGMPSPAWRRAYATILDGLATDAQVLHWGDIDEGGFRIAAVLADTAAAAGHRLQPWRMSPDSVDAARGIDTRLPASATLAAMCRWARRAGWDTVADALQARPLCLEQEALTAGLPGDDMPA